MSSTKARGGFTLAELLIVTVVVAVLASMAVPKFRNVLVKAHVNSVVADGKVLYSSFQGFYAGMYMYPNATSNPFFDLATFEPLRGMGLYDGNMRERLNGNQADAYDSPDDEGPNQEFWVLFSIRIDPSYQVVVASSDNTPLGNGAWLEGVYTFKNGELIAGPGVDSGG